MNLVDVNYFVSIKYYRVQEIGILRNNVILYRLDVQRKLARVGKRMYSHAKLILFIFPY